MDAGRVALEVEGLIHVGRETAIMGETLDELQSYISQKLRDPDDYRSEIRTIVDELAAPGKISRLLSHLLQDRSLLERTAANSYTHHNGFDKITLLSSTQPEYKLRLHIWWPGGIAAGQEHIHNHSWNFSSALLTGAFKFQIFQIADQGEPMYHYLCGFPDAGIGYKMDYLGQACLQCEFDCLMRAGSTYSLSSDTLHRIVNVGNHLTSTIMLHGHFIRKTSMLFSHERIPHAAYVRAIPFTAQEFENRLSSYLSLIP